MLRVLTDTQTSQAGKLITLNIVSASTVAVLSFYLNRKYVFKNDEVSNHMFIPFLLVTLTGIFILQSLIIGFSLKNLDPLAGLLMEIGSVIPVVKNFSLNFYEANLAKLFATAASMIWNYTLYNKIIFRPKEIKTNGSF